MYMVVYTRYASYSDKNRGMVTKIAHDMTYVFACLIPLDKSNGDIRRVVEHEQLGNE
jgi:hypothetical protein